MSRQRYEKEIEQILKKAGETPRREQARRRQGTEGGGRVSVRRLVASYKVLLLAGIIMLIASYVVSNLYVFLASIGLIAAGYVMYYRAPRAASVSGGGPSSSDPSHDPGPKMWRGRPIDPDDPPGVGGPRRR